MFPKPSWNNIKFLSPRRNYVANKSQKPIKGFDTETLNGYCKILADNSTSVTTDGIADVLSFLCRKENRSTLNFFYNLTFDAEVMLKHDMAILRQLARTGKAEQQGFCFRYIPKKCLTVRDSNRNTYKFYDIAQFFSCSLAAASEKYLNEKPHELKTERGTLFENHSLEKIKEYCKDDASKTQRLAQFLFKTFSETGLVVNKPYSAGYVSQEYALRFASVPCCFDLPPIVAKLYWLAYRGGWFDTYKRGVLNITSYDISSAYPAAMLKLQDIRQGRWKRGIEDKSSMGVVLAEISGNLDRCNPIAVKQRSGNIYPLFDKPHKTALTLQEYFALKETLEIKEIMAYSFIPNDKVRMPYSSLIEKLYGIKQSFSSSDARYLTAKLILNSLYGKTAQLTKRGNSIIAGTLFNPCYAAETTASVRVSLFNAIKPYSKHVVSLLTDAVLFDKPVELPSTKGIGSFGLKHKNSRCLMLRTGVYEFFEAEKATRGFSKKNSLWELCNNPKPVLFTKTFRPQHFKECIVQNRCKDIGVFQETEREINLNYDFKRLWLQNLHSASELLENCFESAAVPLSLLPQ